ncbi:armadillo-type protein, partial [Amylocarpus encephaloides]
MELDDEGEGEEEYVSMENLFLAALDELEGQMTFLLTDRFASHTLRVLLVILSGRPLEKEETNSLLKSKRKEKVGIANMDSTPTEVSLNKRAVPESFQFAVEKIISDTVATMDASFIRVLATHPTGNPTLQLLLELELTNPNSKKGANSEKKTIISSLLPDDVETEGSSSAVFINGIMYDQIGSRLLETICTYAPAKLFKQIYKTTFKDRIAGLARNEISSYVVMKVLTRISKEDLEDAVEQICPQISGLVERNRTVIIKTLMERCHVRRSTKSVEKLTAAIGSAYGSEPETLLLKMACIEDVEALIKHTTAASQPEEVQEMPEQSEEASKKSRRSAIPKQFLSTPQQTHGSLLAQSLITTPGPPSTLIQGSLLALPQPTLHALTLYLPTSHILQSAMDPSTAAIFRRKLINKFLFSPEHEDIIFTLAMSPIGSHFLDALLSSTASTQSLFILTERVAETLRKREVQLRESFTGRIIWRNWHLDLYKRKRGEWVNTVKEAATAKYPPRNAPQEEAAEVEDTAAVKPNAKNKKKNKNGNGKFDKKADQGPKKSAIQLAMERFAEKKKRPDANATKLGLRKRPGERKEDMVHPDRRTVAA